MSAFRDAVRAMLQDGLICPACSAMNRPGVTYIVVEATERAECTICSHVGPIVDFQREK